MHSASPVTSVCAVADALLAAGDLGQVGLLALRPERHVADRVVVVRRRVGLPDLDVGRHQLGHRRLEVVVAHDAAGDPGRAGRDTGLVDDQDVLARSLAPRLELLGEVVGGRQAVDARPDHDEADALRQFHAATPYFLGGNSIAGCSGTWYAGSRDRVNQSRAVRTISSSARHRAASTARRDGWRG